MIANHALYFADLAVRGAPTASGSSPSTTRSSSTRRTGSRRRPRPGSAAGSRWRGSASSRATSSGCREQAATPPARALAELDRAGAELIAAFDPGAGRRRLRGPTATELEAHGAARGRGLGGSPRRSPGSGRRRTRWRAGARARRDLEACLALDDPDRVSWAEPGALAWAPVDVSELLRETLWERGPTAVLVSATLEPRFLRERLGLDDAREVIAALAVRLPRAGARLRARRASPSRARRATTTAWRTRSSRSAALARPGARPDVLLPGARRAGGARAPRLAYPVLVQGDAPRERLLERFRDDVDSVLFATATFWQGVDVQGESLSLLVVDKLPFAAPATRSSRRAASGSPGGRRLVPRVRAALGRPPAPPGIRPAHPRSRGRGRRRDPRPRLRTRAYGRRFLEALPPAPLVVDRAAVAEFFGAGARATA